MLERDLYIQNSEALRNHLARVVVEHSVRISRLAYLFGHTPPQNTGILTEEESLYQTAQVRFGNDDRVQSADIITGYSKDYFIKKDADAHLQFTPEGVVINEDWKRGFLDERINWRALINANGVEAEMSCDGVIEAWNEWNELMAGSWHARKIIIAEDKDISLAVKTKYNNTGRLIACTLGLSSVLQPVDLLPLFSSKAMGRLKKKKHTEPRPEDIDWAKLLGRDTPQEEIDPPFMLPVGSRLTMAVYTGIAKNSGKYSLPTDFEYTLRIRPFTSDDEYNQIYYPNFFEGTCIAPVLYPSLPEIAKQGYLHVNRFLSHVRLEPPFAESEVDVLLAKHKGKNRA